MFKITVEDEFSAGHFLRGYKGKCENMHGHNYKVIVVVSGKKLNEIGLLIDFDVVKGKLREIMKEFDHTVINEHKYFKKNNPSAENIAKYFFIQLKKDVKVSKVSIWETSKSWATYAE
ncbi:MAG: 6-carboxytetrahydropterin synthase QueD [Candidatus Firestonebacteria bacterium]